MLVERETGEEMRLGRYGVWEHDGHKYQVVACGDDLDALQAEHGPGLPVRLLGSGPARPA